MESSPGNAWSGVVRRETNGRTLQRTVGTLTSGGRPVEGGSRFQAGSVSKTVLAISALHLVELDLLDLDGPISRWAPALPRDKGCLTLHQLLTHTAGLGHWRDLPGVDVADPPEHAELLRMVLDQAAPGPVGRFSYSNFGYLLAAHVLEDATGRTYAEIATAAVLDPAGMGSTSTGVFPIGAADCAVGQRDGEPVQISPTPTSIPGTGDLWTTVEDLIRLARAVHSGVLLRPELVRTMTTALISSPSVITISDDRITAHGYGYGYGTWIGALTTEPAAIHPGDNVGYRSLLVHLLHRDDNIAILTNDDGPSIAMPLDLVLNTAS